MAAIKQVVGGRRWWAVSELAGRSSADKLDAQLPAIVREAL